MHHLHNEKYMRRNISSHNQSNALRRAIVACVYWLINAIHFLLRAQMPHSM